MTIIIHSLGLYFLAWHSCLAQPSPNENEGLNFVTVREENIIKPKKDHLGTVIFLHDMMPGDDQTTLNHLKNLTYSLIYDIPHLKLIFPIAPLMPFSFANGTPYHIWFDRKRIHPNEKENLTTYENSLTDIGRLIQNEINLGIPIDKIILGGHGMGGELSLHLALRFMRNMSGVFSINSFLPFESIVYEELYELEKAKFPWVLLCGSSKDAICSSKWTETTHIKLSDVDVHSRSYFYRFHNHDVSMKILYDVFEWVLRQIPDLFGPNKIVKALI